MKWKSTSGIRLNVESFLASYHSFENGMVNELTNTDNGPKRHLDMMNLLDNVRDFNRRATEFVKSDDFDTLDPKLRDDLQTIVNETSIAVMELGAELDPDQHFAKLPPQMKREALQHTHVDNTFVATMRARLKGELVDQVITPRPPVPEK